MKLEVLTDKEFMMARKCGKLEGDAATLWLLLSAVTDRLALAESVIDGALTGKSDQWIGKHAAEYRRLHPGESK